MPHALDPVPDPIIEKPKPPEKRATLPPVPDPSPAPSPAPPTPGPPLRAAA